jgi:hypothetical protein
MIGETAIDVHLRKTKRLFDSVAWYDAHTTDVKRTIIDLIRYDQLRDKGEDSEQQVIGYYSLLTELISGGKKRFNTPYTLEDTGLFYRSMFVTVLRDSIVIDATTDHMEDEEWWRTEIMGLNEENLDKYASLIRENYIKHARKQLGLD